MKPIMMLASVIATGVLLTTGCSTCCKKEGACTKPAASACTGACCSDPATCAKCCKDEAGCKACCKK